MTERPRVLVIDDEQVIREGCKRALESDGCSAETAADGREGIERLKAEAFDAVLLDLMMPGLDGFQVLEWAREHRPETPVVVITGFATVSKAVAAMKQGAFDFVGKPFTPDYIRIVVRRALAKRELEREAERLREEKVQDLMVIAEEKSRLKTVFRSMADGVIVTNRDMIVVHHNPAAIKTLQIQTDPLVGKPLADSIRNAELVEMTSEAVREGRFGVREFPPGTISRGYMRARCSPVLSADGEILGAVTLFQDISEQKTIDRQKSEFVAMVAHELRSPLASVEQMIYAAAAGCEHMAGTDCERLHARMTARTKELLQLIANLLSLSKLESASPSFRFEPLCGAEIVEDVVEVLRPQAEKMDIALSCEPDGRDWWFNGDYDHIRGALMNVIGNAIKYTPPGGRVEVRRRRRPGLVVLEVRDSGIGIAPEDVPHIFDRFFRVKGKATRQITGSGLGLSIVQKVVEAHQGFIDVESEPGRGTTFTLSFPAVEPPRTGLDV